MCAACMCLSPEGSLKLSHLLAHRPAGLQALPDLRFTYEEESNPEDFFVPYVWSLVLSSVAMPWNTKAVVLFSPYTPDGPPTPV